MESNAAPATHGQGRRTGCLARAGRVLLSLLAVLALLAAAGAAYEAFARANELSGVTAPGRYVDIGGRRLHIHCVGEASAGRPTVVLESGVGGWSIHWHKVQRELAQVARVCAYDRAGYGWSDAGQRPRDGRQIVAELRTLLERSGEPGPYLLVGASRGGQYARLYQAAHPEDVAGIVLVDAEPEEFRSRSAYGASLSAQNQAVFSVLGGLSRIGALRLLGGDPASAPALPCAPSLVKSLPAEAHGAYLAVEGQPRCFDAVLGEEAASETREALLRDLPALGDLPLTVLARTPQTDGSPEAAEAERVWHELQRALATLSSEGLLIVADDSGHDIATEQPELVLNAVRAMLDQVTAE